MNAGLLLLRTFVGLLLSAHGSQKLLGWFQGKGLDGASESFERFGYTPARLMAVTAGVSEMASGLLLAMGFLTPVGSTVAFGTMLVAASVNWHNGLWNVRGGYELAALYAGVAAALAFTGPGEWSIDSLIGLDRISGIGSGIVVAAGGTGAGLLVARRAGLSSRRAFRRTVDLSTIRGDDVAAAEDVGSAAKRADR